MANQKRNQELTCLSREGVRFWEGWDFEGRMNPTNPDIIRQGVGFLNFMFRRQ